MTFRVQVDAWHDLRDWGLGGWVTAHGRFELLLQIGPVCAKVTISKEASD